jgi:hypothetical protein
MTAAGDVRHKQALERIEKLMVFNAQTKVVRGACLEVPKVLSNYLMSIMFRSD